jgi:dipicolinate synthase subunit B
MSIATGFALCGSFCTIRKVIEQMKELSRSGFDIYPIVSDIVYSTDTRFGKAADIINDIENISGKKVIHSIADAEPIGPKNFLDIMIVAPATGNTMAKLALGITDTPVTMAAKATLRNKRPVLLAPATNDALGASAANIGTLLNTRNIYFVPFSQDDPVSKERSMIADFTKIKSSAIAALNSSQSTPVIF